ncbi:hypothetical protein KIL84_014029 [Mauremys mutica]|uniref:Uncharacterized protein n=1 Tax=Mauremys mutica TaxID=74926 RepID=A0A9D4AT25_9SAUR|nr:hypothetical protein KIL84_014029 [Mauremys mutica]
MLWLCYSNFPCSTHNCRKINPSQNSTCLCDNVSRTSDYSCRKLADHLQPQSLLMRESLIQHYNYRICMNILFVVTYYVMQLAPCSSFSGESWLFGRKGCYVYDAS